MRAGDNHMNRRTILRTLIAAAAVKLPAAETQGKQPIQLHVDLDVDPAKETETLHVFHTRFKPVAARQPGYIDVQMLKLRSALQGEAPKNSNYRFVLTYASEEQRQTWINTAIHKERWPEIENLLASKQYTVLLYDVK
jgi:heme-degrading monooxygenase HmoA